MKLTRFEVCDYRSFEDSKDVRIPEGNLLTLVGQNESGKTSLLRALESFSTGHADFDDYRHAESPPQVFCTFKLRVSELPSSFPGHDELLSYLSKTNGEVTLVRLWRADDPEGRLELSDDMDQHISGGLWLEEGELNEDLIASVLSTVIPLVPPMSLFESQSSLLPRSIPLSALLDSDQSHQGYRGALNFLGAAQLNLNKIADGSDRQVTNRLARASANVTRDLHDVWTQTTGGTTRVSLESRWRTTN